VLELRHARELIEHEVAKLGRDSQRAKFGAGSGHPGGTERSFVGQLRSVKAGMDK
jgi:hypothetical protein